MEMDEPKINVEPAIEREKNTHKDDPRLSWYPVPWGRYLYTSNGTIHRVSNMMFDDALDLQKHIITTTQVDMENIDMDYQANNLHLHEEGDRYVHTKMNILEFRKCFISMYRCYHHP